jgi:hypothetical protein
VSCFLHPSTQWSELCFWIHVKHWAPSCIPNESPLLPMCI